MEPVTFFHDLRNALRSLHHSPGYAIACVAILALGIGANTAIFSLIDSIILKPLPYADSDRLVFLWEKFPGIPEPLTNRMPPSRTVYREWRRASSFTNVAAFVQGAANESGVERPRRLSKAFVSTDLFPMLGTRPALGRLFQAHEEQPGSDTAAILSDEYFAQRFNRDAGAIGKTIGLDGIPYTIVGVLPRRFQLPATFQGENRNPTDVFVPLSRRWNRPQDDYETILSVAAKLKSGVTVDQARAEILATAKQLQAADPEHYPPEMGANVFSFRVEDQAPGLDRQLYLLLGAVGFFLLIACANLANLTLARATSRAREIAIRRALGATRGRIIAQSLTESLIVSLTGAAAGLLVAVWLVSGLLLLAPDNLNRPDVLEFRWPVFAFAAAAGVFTTILFGLFPALAVSGTDVHGALKAGGRTSTGSGFRSRQLLTAAEIAIALVLLTGAGLLVRTVVNLVTTGIGIDMNRLAVVDVDLPESRYPDDDSRERFLSDLLSRVRLVPGVSGAGMTSTLPLHRILWGSFTLEGHPAPAPNGFLIADHAEITPDYFNAIGLSVVAGRGLTARDGARNRGKGTGAALINQAFAEKFLPGENPLGQRLVFGDRPFEIVGVASNFRALGPTEEMRPQFFRAGVRGNSSILVLRTTVKPESLTEEVRQTFWSLDKEFPAVDVASMEAYFLSGAIAEEAFDLVLLAAFAALGLLLAMTGVYSVLAHLVASRRREIGIRMALGASQSAIARMVVYESLYPVGIGLTAGFLGSLALSRVLESILFQVSPRDPLTFFLAFLTVVLAAPAAIWIPMRRATHVECTVALRDE